MIPAAQLLGISTNASSSSVVRDMYIITYSDIPLEISSPRYLLFEFPGYSVAPLLYTFLVELILKSLLYDCTLPHYPAPIFPNPYQSLLETLPDAMAWAARVERIGGASIV